MKKIISIFLAAALTVAVSFRGYADDLSEFDCRNYSDLFDAKEYAEVISQTGGDYLMREAVSLEGGSSDIGKAAAYKMYYSIVPDFLGRLSEGADISELVGKDYSWLIPGENIIVKVKLDEEKVWQTVSYSIPYHDPDGIVKSDVVEFDAVNAAVGGIDIGDPSEIKNILCVQSRVTFTYFICVMLDDETYVIPFGARPDFTGLENGALYSTDEARTIIMQNMPDIFEEVEPTDDPLEMGIGGAGFETWTPVEKTDPPAESRKITPLLPLVLISAAVIAGGITAAVLVWNRKSKHKR